MSQQEAGKILSLGVCQIKRLLKAYRKKGAAGLSSKHRGRPANNRLKAKVKNKALDLLKGKYQGFGPTLTHEKLTEKEGLTISVESVRQLMIEERLWKPRKVKKEAVHQLRGRRACFIDDATGKLLRLLFVENKSFFSYCQAVEAYFRQYGKPIAFYTVMLRKRHFSGQYSLGWAE